MITIYLNNSTSYNCWVGGENHGDPVGIKVPKTETKFPYKMDPSVGELQTWYYDYGWYSGASIDGPFVDGKTYTIENQTCFYSKWCCGVL